MQNIKERLANLVWLVITIFILSLVAGTTIHIFASFTEPLTAPSASDQDFPENILGANNADNAYNSDAVVASSTGSIIERLEYINDKMYQIQDWPGRGWVASSSGNASTSLTREACDSASNWEWFEDGNGDGDYIDPEDGVCVKISTETSTNWGGHETSDNSYIAAYTCSGSFPNGIVATGPTTCALCVADCYDGRKDLPDQGSYTSPNNDSEIGYTGPITPVVLKNWEGTRLPTSLDFYGFCGYQDGGDDYEIGCSSVTTSGTYGQMTGRTDECLDLSNSETYEWLSEQSISNSAQRAGYYACSNVSSLSVDSSFRFRAVFRP